MQNLGFLQLAVLIMVGLNLLMVALTIGAKALHSLQGHWKKAKIKKLEPALDEGMMTGKVSL